MSGSLSPEDPPREVLSLERQIARVVCNIPISMRNDDPPSQPVPQHFIHLTCPSGYKENQP